ncbi:MAG TPA: exo-alpha-sialidase [Spirochaetia bacterium]|nr:exo-alpha-sialidase [Spirochaetia bacterium]
MSSSNVLPHEAISRLKKLASALIDQEKARIVVPPKRSADGYWFGGGNLAEDSEGIFYLSGRYRNAGDSRTGLGAGERGLELAIFRSADRGRSFEPVVTMKKAELGRPGREVISIEGSALHFGKGGVELFVSSEKGGIPYPENLERFRKPGTGIWTIDVTAASRPEELSPDGLTSLFESNDPAHLHVKDPHLYRTARGEDVAVFCSHPFNWSSSNSCYAVRPRGGSEFGKPRYGFFARGFAWDVAMSRITGTLPVPRVGRFRELPPLILFFYDGGESVRKYEEHAEAVRRPRGYSCEELGGLALSLAGGEPEPERISTLFPSFVSPYGTGSSRYVRTLTTKEGIYATWQQSQKDRSQPLVMNFLSNEQVGELLA